MTAAARITQADMARATRAVAIARLPNARIIMRLEKAEIEIIVSESAEPAAPTDQWTDDDV